MFFKRTHNRIQLSFRGLLVLLIFKKSQTSGRHINQYVSHDLIKNQILLNHSVPHISLYADCDRQYCSGTYFS
nr:MAG TPA: hypothetical protein [Caudoviricetes sp.]DAR29453.1 MAG TPA: hypothetical protein [Caudoviricetes sp.]